jgi:hypothetical protein
MMGISISYFYPVRNQRWPPQQKQQAKRDAFWFICMFSIYFSTIFNEFAMFFIKSS